MYLQIAIYPEKVSPEVIKKWNNYIYLAAKYNVNEIFTSIHLPEYDRNIQIESLEILNSLAKKMGMEISVDIGGAYLDKYMNDTDISERIRNMKLDFIRIDYGITLKQIEKMCSLWNNKGVVINASIYRKEELYDLISGIKDLSVELRACHNYYPRKDTGLSKQFYKTQQAIFDSFNIPVYICLANSYNSRGPVHEGLVTIEQHRTVNFEQALLDSIYNLKAQGIMLADEFFNEDDLCLLNNAVNNKTLQLHTKIYDGVSAIERKAIFGKKHRIRYDSNDIVLRSESSREMSQFAVEIEPFNAIERNKLSITVDNRLYKRYSGEVQIVLTDLPKDERVNVVGCIDEKDAYKLNYYHDYVDYLFVE